MWKTLAGTPLRKLLAVVLVIGLALGGWALWGNSPAQGQGPRGKGNPGIKAKGVPQFPAINRAIKQLIRTKQGLIKARKIFHGHRRAAIGHIDQAIRQLQMALKDHDPAGGKKKRRR
jgi:hypothetical protein